MNKKILISIAIISIVSVIFSFYLNQLYKIETNNKPDFTLGYKATVCAEKNGVLLGCVPNVLTDTGKDFIEAYLGQGLNQGGARVITVGNGSAPTSTSTSHPNEITDCGFGRQTGTYQNNGIGWWNVTYTYTSTCSITVNTTGLLNQTGAGFAYIAGATITPAVLSSGDTLKITWNITQSEV